MGDIFEIVVDYKGDTLTFNGELHSYGYSYKIEVEVFKNKFYFEPDEERNFRVVMNSDNYDKEIRVDVSLLECIADAIKKILS